MSDAQPTIAPVVGATEPVVAPTATDAPVALPETTATTEAAKPVEPETAAAPVTTEAAPAEDAKADAVAEKAVEPISEGQLAYKGPGLVKSLIPSKKEFWLSDAAVEPQNLHLFLRGEKPEISHPIVAWASQTGKGLLFFNKKGDTDRTHPGDVLALYDAADLKKESQHQFGFKLHGHNHTFKAANDAERDGWYLSVEKAIELAKASKEEVESSEGYKAELEKLSKPSVPAAGVAGAAAGAAATPKKSAETGEPAAATETKEADKKQKSRSTSRGILNRFKGNKEATDAEKKEDEAKPEGEASKVAEVAAPVAVAGGATAVAAESTAEEKPAEAVAETPATSEAKVDEKPKPSKRGSIFGKMPWGVKSPAKEKDLKEAELGAAPVSENPPVLPETATTTTEPATEAAVPAVAEPTTEAAPIAAATEAPKESAAEAAVSPSKEKSGFLSSFMKRSRSVSPSTQLKEQAKKEETVAAPTTEAATEAPIKAEEPVTEAAAESTEKPAETAEEAKGEPAKRQSMLGSLGRRASKAFKGMQAPKKDSAAPAAAEENKAHEAADTETPAVNGETMVTKTEGEPATIADVVPEAVSVGQPQSTPVVTASA